jgi:hypothetical protein
MYSGGMNYYEQKQLQDRESRMIGAGISLILMSPAFGIGVFIVFPSAATLYVTTAIVASLGVLSIAAGIKEKNERKRIIS